MMYLVTFLCLSLLLGWKALVINSYDLFILVCPMPGIKALKEVQEMFIDLNWSEVNWGKVSCISLISLLHQLSSFIIQFSWIIRFQIRKRHTKFVRQKRQPKRKPETENNFEKDADIIRLRENKSLLVKIWRGWLVPPTSPREQR